MCVFTCRSGGRKANQPKPGDTLTLRSRQRGDETAHRRITGRHISRLASQWPKFITVSRNPSLRRPDYDRRVTWQSLRSRLLSPIVRPTARPLSWGVLVAAAFITAEALLVLMLKRLAPENAFGAIFLLGVLVISAGWGLGLAVSPSVASALVYIYFHLEGGDSLLPATAVFLVLALLANLLVGQARLRAAESSGSPRKSAGWPASRRRLRRVATRVARGAALTDVYHVAVQELAQSLHVDHVTVLRFDPDGHCVVVAAHDHRDGPGLSVGEGFHWTAKVSARRSGTPDNPPASKVTKRCPAPSPPGCAAWASVRVQARRSSSMAWYAAQSSPAARASSAIAFETQIADVADLIATAIANSETRAELTASRSRIVAAADGARRGFEQDLHDGAQQRIVSLSLELRAVEAAVPDTDTELRTQLSNVVTGLAGLYSDLQELSRGIHPAILSRGGLGPAIKTLARRSPVPVQLEVNVDRRLPESVEVAAYYVAAEAMTNSAKHANAAEITVRAVLDDARLQLSVIDDGIGGATPGGGSGLIGLKDRVEALSGQLSVTSPPGEGCKRDCDDPGTSPDVMRRAVGTRAES